MKDQLRKIRMDQGMTQAEFGAATGKGRDTITSYELGRVVPDDTFIQLLAIKFGYNADWIKTGDGDPRPPESVAYNIGKVCTEAARLDPEQVRQQIMEYVKDMPPETIVLMWQLLKTSKGITVPELPGKSEKD